MLRASIEGVRGRRTEDGTEASRHAARLWLSHTPDVLVVAAVAAVKAANAAAAAAATGRGSDF